MPCQNPFDKALRQRSDWVESFRKSAVGRTANNTAGAFAAYKSLLGPAPDSEDLIHTYESLASETKSALRDYFWAKCISVQDYSAFRKAFLSSLGAFQGAAYILGIGDRHLENFLVDVRDGSVVGIDFGYSFGVGATLPVPELMPIRATPSLLALDDPLVDRTSASAAGGLSQGYMAYAMRQSLRTIRSMKYALHDLCAIFVSEPLIDWQAAAAKRANETVSAAADSSVESKPSGANKDSAFVAGGTVAAWYPQLKINALMHKIEGRHPVSVLLDELGENRSWVRAHLAEHSEFLKESILLGKRSSYRRSVWSEYSHRADRLDVDTQSHRVPCSPSFSSSSCMTDSSRNPIESPQTEVTEILEPPPAGSRKTLTLIDWDGTCVPQWPVLKPALLEAHNPSPASHPQHSQRSIAKKGLDRCDQAVAKLLQKVSSFGPVAIVTNAPREHVLHCLQFMPQSQAVGVTVMSSRELVSNRHINSMFMSHDQRVQLMNDGKKVAFEKIFERYKDSVSQVVAIGDGPCERLALKSLISARPRVLGKFLQCPPGKSDGFQVAQSVERVHDCFEDVLLQPVKRVVGTVNGRTVELRSPVLFVDMEKPLTSKM